MLKTCFIFLTLLLSLTVQAQSSGEGPFAISTYAPNDSIVEIDALLAQDVQWVWIQVTKGSKNENIFINTKTEKFLITSYLKFGPGRYNINVFVTNTSEMLSTSYSTSNKFQIQNYDERLDLASLFPSSEIQSQHPKIVSLAKEITAGLKNEMEKTKAIHTWVTNNIAYDVEGYFSGTYNQTKHDAVSTLKSRKAVCEGYANLTAALNRAVGIFSKKVQGEVIFGDQAWTGRINHAWNEMLVNGVWIIQDTTWDAGTVDFTKQIYVFGPKLQYFNPIAEEFAKNHRVIKKD
jgi:hypothetical protein